MSLTKVTSKDTTSISAGWDAFNTLIDDLLAVTANKGASQVGVQDSAENFTGINVETILAEIQATVDALSTTFTDLDENSATTTGLTWGYKAGTIQFNNAITAVEAGTVGLTDDKTNYVEVNSSGTVARNTTGFNSGSIPLRLIVCAGGAQSSSTDKRSWLVGTTTPTTVAMGGTGAQTFTDHGIILGSGTGAMTVTGAPTNGQLLIGHTGADPDLATLAGTSNQITVTNSTGTITLSIPANLLIPTVLTVPNTGLHLLDSNASHDLIVKPGSDLTADRILTITTGDAARTITLGGDLDVPAGGTMLTGDGSASTKAWFYQNAAPTGWTVVTTSEALMGAKAASGTYTTGGALTGSWTQSDHTLETTEIPEHEHPGTVQSAGTGTNFSRYVGSQDEGAAIVQCYPSSGSTGGATGHNHGSTWRPYAYVNIQCSKD